MDKPIEATVPVLVSGELAQQEDIWKLLVGRSGHPVQMLPLPMETPEGFPSSQYATNIGLALKELAPEKGIAYSLVNFNALPEVYIPKPRPISEILFVPTIVAGIALVALVAFLNVTSLTNTTALRDELAIMSQRVASQLAQTKDMSSETTALEEQISSIEATADAFSTTLSDFAAGRDEVNGDLSEINSRLPGAVDLQSVTHSGATLTVKGLADDEGAIFRYAKDLRAGGRFALVVITDVHEVELRMGFTLTLTKFRT